MKALTLFTAIFLLAAFVPALAADLSVCLPTDSNTCLDERVSDNRDRIRQTNSEIRDAEAGVALSNALSAHSYDFDHDGMQASIATGGYEGAYGWSIGFAVKPSEHTLLNMQGGQSSRGDTGASMALGIKF